MNKHGRARLAAVATAAALATTSLVTAGVGPAVGYPYSIQVKQSGKSVTKAKFYREYQNARTVLDSEFDAGRLRIEATPYKISEGMKKYDQWLLSLRVSTKDKTGGARLAWANIFVQPKKYGKVSDSAATRDRALGDCDTLDLNLNLGFGPISTSADVGNLTGCSQAKLDLTSHSKTTGATGWKLGRLKRFARANAELYLQVPRGYEPNFRITVTTPIDSCEHSSEIPPNQCIPRDHDATMSYVVDGQT